MSGYPHYQHNYLQKPQPKVNGLAIASLILGIASLLLSCLAGLVGLILGFLAIVQIQSSNGRSTGMGMAITGIILSILLSFVVPLFVIIPAFATGVVAVTGQASAAARDVQTQNNIRQVVLAMHEYHAVHHELPNDHYINGKPALSWRVMILPHLEGGKRVFDEFNLNQPWDSIQNLEASRQIPDVFRSNLIGVGADETTIMRPIGNGALFEGTDGEKVTLERIQDGTSNTIACVEVNVLGASVWSKPTDFEFQPADPTHGLTIDKLHQAFRAGFADGSVHNVSVGTGISNSRLFTRAGND